MPPAEKKEVASNLCARSGSLPVQVSVGIVSLCVNISIIIRSSKNHECPLAEMRTAIHALSGALECECGLHLDRCCWPAEAVLHPPQLARPPSAAAALPIDEYRSREFPICTAIAMHGDRSGKRGSPLALSLVGINFTDANNQVTFSFVDVGEFSRVTEEGLFNWVPFWGSMGMNAKISVQIYIIDTM